MRRLAAATSHVRRLACAGASAADRFDTESGLPEGIKLGLGDFIFYSVLVGRAGMHDLLTAAAAYLAIIAGAALCVCILGV